MARSLYVKGPTIGLPKDIPFRADREYTFCRICGEMFQPHIERVPDDAYTERVKASSMAMQRKWAARHNRTHPDWQHKQFAASGRFLSPEATYRLVPYGVLPLSDLVFSDENEHAGLEAPRISDFTNYEWGVSKKERSE